VYQGIKKDLHFNSSSGGTDINGCFFTGSPIQPVYAGELQGPGLGMKVKAYDEKGCPVFDQQGELAKNTGRLILMFTPMYGVMGTTS
jgi:acetoacetyl-CoA synthetase